MPSQNLQVMVGRLFGATMSDVSTDHTSETAPSIAAALFAIELGDAKGAIAAMRDLSPELRGLVLRNTVVLALDQGSDLGPLRAMTMLLPRRGDLHVGLGFAHLVRGAYLEAHKSFRCALALDPVSAVALLGCGVALHSLGQEEQAVPFLIGVVQQDNGTPIGQAAASILLQLLDEGGSAAPPEKPAQADNEPIPYVPGTANGIILY